MDIERAIELIEVIANGVDPCTEELMSNPGEKKALDGHRQVPGTCRIS